ncbi:unnamed protein product [Schistosoma mattheei]|uniref:Uncharacterized protein n=1 Tax=Schistosoma mattheei TaxID=31246 RepID=A0A183PDB5_9TREM|nr:unnamed protein product [Schistosoma mattheei]
MDAMLQDIPGTATYLDDILIMDYMQSNQRSTSSNQPNFPRKRNTHVQGLKSRLRSNINSILSNYEMILSRSKIDPNEVTKGLGPYAQCAQDTFEFSVRAANIVSFIVKFLCDYRKNSCPNVFFKLDFTNPYSLNNQCVFSSFGFVPYVNVYSRLADEEQLKVSNY